MLDIVKEYYEAESQVSEDIRYEVFEGVIYAMAPPSADHQTIIKNLARQLDAYLTGKKCETFLAPFGVNLTEFMESKKKTVYQPDISVVCDQAKLARRTGTYYGAPSLVVEVGSPATIDRDLIDKKNGYEQAGVQEYLVVLDSYTVNRYALQNGVYQKQLCEADDAGVVTIPITHFPGLTLEIRQDWFWFSR